MFLTSFFQEPVLLMSLFLLGCFLEDFREGNGPLQGGPRTDPEPETGTVGTVFAGTERGTGTAGTVLQEPKPEPSSLWNCAENTQNPPPERNRRNRKPEPLVMRT